ncbi:EAL domain-containing protein [Pseudoalteromonas sp. SG41-5]|uniref:EAL domain-containing protein n=1 Tax=Pseudoalteromonas sp. SG41-5 TaxID=2760975 RepID=UPI0016010EF4|nr:EAL domain-containing protein [Pseudoalteromonas sp. SG41-5]MBB1469925.1 EAL domain-containing protein [Pseudoalteromonas sp. SG41-5]
MSLRAFKEKPSAIIFFLPLLLLLLICISHFGANYVQMLYQKKFTQSLISKAEEISSDISQSIYQTEAINPRRCDEETVNKLRILLTNYHYTHDVGLVKQNRIICSANWGILKEPVELNVDFFKGNTGFYFAQKVEGIFPIDAKYDIAKRNGIVAFTIQDPFKYFDQANKDFSFNITSIDGLYVFHQFDSEFQFDNEFNLLSQEVKSCSTKFGYCASVLNNRPGLLFFSTLTLTAVLLLLCVISFLIIYSFISYIERTNSIEFRLRNAIADESIYLEYQPILEVQSKQIIGVECLIRWKDEVYGQVSPELFLSIAEQLNLYPSMAFSSVQRAFKELSPFVIEKDDFSIAINVNSFEIQSSEYLPFLNEQCELYKISQKQIKIEITERIGLPLNELSHFALQAKRYGFTVALDDFGTGVSNLVWLTEINFDIIKIDRIFTQSITDPLKKDMLLAIMALFTNLNRIVIFEGVETQEQCEFIEKYNKCYQVQGWYFYKALPLDALKELIV